MNNNNNNYNYNTVIIIFLYYYMLCFAYAGIIVCLPGLWYAYYFSYYLLLQNTHTVEL